MQVQDGESPKKGHHGRHSCFFRLLGKRAVVAYRGEEPQGCRLGVPLGREGTEEQGH